MFLPRICCDSTRDNDLPFAFCRYQFPVKLTWATTVNKSQGQGFGARLGIYLPKPVFAHGQLYVAMSRAVTAANVRIMAEPYLEQQLFVTDSKNIRYLQTLNIVDAQFFGKPTHASSQIPQPQYLKVSADGHPTISAMQPRRRLRTKTPQHQWEHDAAMDATPVASSEPILPPLSSDKHDVDLEVLSVPVQTDDILASECLL